MGHTLGIDAWIGKRDEAGTGFASRPPTVDEWMIMEDRSMNRMPSVLGALAALLLVGAPGCDMLDNARMVPPAAQ